MASEDIDPVSQVAEALLTADNIGHAVVTVEDQEGTITLRGTVESEQDLYAVEALVGQQPSVIQVVNRLRVSDVYTSS